MVTTALCNSTYFLLNYCERRRYYDENATFWSNGARTQRGFRLKHRKSRRVSYKGLEEIELGDSDPKLSSVLNISVALGINLEELNSCIPVLK